MTLRTVGKVIAGAAAVSAATGVGLAARRVLAALGGSPDPAVVARSARYRDGAFHNVAPRGPLDPAASKLPLREFLDGREARRPAGEIPLVRPEGPAPADGVHLTWYGHASSLVELDGTRILLDPVWSDRVSPVPFVGPRRRHPVPHRLDELPELDAIVISHDHYDHLDMPTVRELARTRSAPFVVPLGVGAHLRSWGVAADRVVELDWHEHTAIGGVRITATPAQHFSGRSLRRNPTLWASWVLAGPRHRVFYSADTGYFDGFAAIGERYGPFDAALVQIGAYAEGWPDIHMTPEEGVAAHVDVRAGLLVPVHWATFTLALHGWSEPVDRLWREAKARGVSIAVPRPGERVTVDAPPKPDAWWQSLC